MEELKADRLGIADDDVVPTSPPRPSRIARRVAESQARRSRLTIPYHPPLLCVAMWLLAFVTPQTEIGRLDIYWNWCPLIGHCSGEQPVPVPAGWPELDIHQDGYTLRFPSYRELDILRQNGALDASRLVWVLAALTVPYEYSLLQVYVESGVKFSDVILTADQLQTIGKTAVLDMAEPPSRGFCLSPEGCVPLAADVVIARLIDKGGRTPSCAEGPFLVVMRYKILRVIGGRYGDSYVDVAQRCPDEGWGPSKNSFQVGATYRLTLPDDPRRFPRGVLIDKFKPVGQVRFASQIQLEQL